MATAVTNTLDDKLKRLQEARKKAEDISQRKQRVSGELDGHRKRLAELEKKCQDEFGCEIKELPNLIKELETEAEKSIAEAERILNPPAQSSEEVEDDEIEDKVPPVATSVPPRVPVQAPLQPKAPIKTPFAKRQPVQDDELGL